MKCRTLAFALLMLATVALPTALAQAPAERAGKVLDQLEAGQFEEVAATFDAQMAAGLDAGTLGQVWTSLPLQLGALQSRGEPVEARQDPYDVVVIPLQFERAAANAIISFNDEQELAGLLIQPAQPAPAAPSPTPAGTGEEP